MSGEALYFGGETWGKFVVERLNFKRLIRVDAASDTAGGGGVNYLGNVASVLKV